MFRIGLVKSSFIPDKEIRVLRELTRYRYKLTSMKSSEKNRFQNAFTVCNVALDSVVSDMFGKSAAAITILSEIGVDMAQFGSSKRLCCWAGYPRQQRVCREEKVCTNFTCRSLSQTCAGASRPRSCEGQAFPLLRA